MAEQVVTERVCVYDIILNGEVVYVGMTKQPNIRMSQHRTNKTVPRESKLVVHRWYNSRPEAGAAEKTRQRELMPAFCKDVNYTPRPVKHQSLYLDREVRQQAADEYNRKYTREQVEEYFMLSREVKTHSEFLAIREKSDNPLFQPA